MSTTRERGAAEYQKPVVKSNRGGGERFKRRK